MKTSNKSCLCHDVASMCMSLLSSSAKFKKREVWVCENTIVMLEPCTSSHSPPVQACNVHMSVPQFTLVSLLCFSSRTSDPDLTGFLSHLVQPVHSQQHGGWTQVQPGPHSSQSQGKVSRLTRWSETDQANRDSWSADERGRERDQTEIGFLNSGGFSMTDSKSLCLVFVKTGRKAKRPYFQSSFGFTFHNFTLISPLSLDTAILLVVQ